MSFGSPSPHLSFARRCEQSPACRLTASFGVPCCAELIYRTSHEDGYKLVAHPRIAGTGYTGRFEHCRVSTLVPAAVILRDPTNCSQVPDGLALPS